MPTKFLIKGPTRLYGTVDVRGSKNAALPILAATLLTKDRCVIDNLPLVSDIYLALDALKGMGARVAWTGLRRVSIENTHIDPKGLRRDIVKKMRASILFTGPLLARFGAIEEMHYPGGCSIGARPIEAHLAAFVDLGAEVRRDKKSFSISISAEDAVSSPHAVVLSEFSVTATENILMFLSAAAYKKSIRIAAAEPHVIDLAKFLSKMGAKIKGAGTSRIDVYGTKLLKGVTYKIVSDYIEAGTFLIMAAACGGELKITNAPISHLDLVIKKLASGGAKINIDEKSQSLTIRTVKRMRLDKIQTLPYPGIPTDLQPILGVFASQTYGKTLIHEALYEKRLESLKELTKMGARVEILDPHRAHVGGPTRLKGGEVHAYDLRSGAALIVAGLVAYGTTIVHGARHVERGYEDLDGRLRKVGAEIKRI